MLTMHSYTMSSKLYLRAGEALFDKGTEYVSKDLAVGVLAELTLRLVAQAESKQTPARSPTPLYTAHISMSMYYSVLILIYTFIYPGAVQEILLCSM